MKYTDDMSIKAEIDRISEKIDAIIKRVEDSENGRSQKTDQAKED